MGRMDGLRATKNSETKRHGATHEYTVGWICALPVELAAAQAMLDEEHTELPRDRFDPNLYTLGCIGKLNVVITCLPAGHMGIGPAAAGAARMMCRFRSIRFGLMVGVGGGVPSSSADIRLGDVVVSHPFKNHGGVVQYDSGKTEGSGQTTRTGSLNSPPPVLLNAVSQLRADRYRGRDSLGQHMAAFDILPRFSRNSLGSDVLYDADYVHRGGSACDGCEPGRLIHRSVRQPPDQVDIHYGTIASGNQVMRDGAARDRPSEELGGVLCFEMEAAGLMNGFPCLVIRGICDYADSHKNKMWQPHAAATAAACAKAILSFVPSPEAPGAGAAREACSYEIPFSLRNVPSTKFAERPEDMLILERALLPQRHKTRQRVMVVHGLGGIGKTQLAATFARRHQHDFSSIFWLDGSNNSTMKQSLVACLNHIHAHWVGNKCLRPALFEDRNVDIVAREMKNWLSIRSNRDWLLVLDNVQSDHRRRCPTGKAFAMDYCIPEADHGSILMTTRSSHLCQLGESWELTNVNPACSLAILSLWQGMNVEHPNDELLRLLDGLPLALAQAACYIRETGISPATYTRLYKEQWRELMKACDQPILSYPNGSLANTWTRSYATVRSTDKHAANLLLLWAHLHNESLWYDLLALASRRSTVVAMQASTLLGKTSCSELHFLNTMKTLRQYSLVHALEGQEGFRMHPVVHQWARCIQNTAQQVILSRLALMIVGNAVPTGCKRPSDARSRLLPHADECATRIELLTTQYIDQHNSDWEDKAHEEGFWALLRAFYSLNKIYGGVGDVKKARLIADQAHEIYENTSSWSRSMIRMTPCAREA